jgi:peptidoglycan/xylan/chitin deacetylase (PgdA/CDA1 family)
MYLVSTPRIVKKILRSDFVWEVKTNEKALWLTFDDGPEPTVTPWVLAELKKYNAKATFFCLGKNVESNPEIFQNILNDGHSVGNHTYNHMKGWHSHTGAYIRDIEKCSELVKTSLFRPPYGKIKPSQFRRLKKNYQVVMWSLLSGDFDIKLEKEKCLDMVLKNTKAGNIIVFHDSLKAKEKLMFVLPELLKYYSEQGFSFLPLNMQR